METPGVHKEVCELWHQKSRLLSTHKKQVPVVAKRSLSMLIALALRSLEFGLPVRINAHSGPSLRRRYSRVKYPCQNSALRFRLNPNAIGSRPGERIRKRDFSGDANGIRVAAVKVRFDRGRFHG